MASVWGRGWSWMGTTASGEGVWAEKGYVPGKHRGGDLWGGVNGPEVFGWVQLTLTFFLDLSWEEVFILLSRVTGATCFITPLEPCGFPVTLVILRPPSGLLQGPWAPLYIPLLRETHPRALWGQQVSSPANGGPGWALTSQSPILTPLAEDGEQFRCFGGRNEAFIIPLRRPPNSPAILISLSQVRWVTGQGGCVSSKAGLLYLLMTVKV